MKCILTLPCVSDLHLHSLSLIYIKGMQKNLVGMSRETFRYWRRQDINKCVMIHYLAVLSACGCILPRNSLGCEVRPHSQQCPLCQPLQVAATRSLQTLSPHSHAFCSSKQTTAPVHIVLPDLLAEMRLCNHPCNNREL